MRAWTTSSLEFRAVIADDQTHFRIVMRNVLSRLGGKVVAQASDGKEAVTAIESHRPDLVLLDIHMPEMTGIEVLEALQGEELAVKVIMLTAAADRATVQRCVELGASGYVRKDTSLAELVAAVESAIELTMRPDTV